MRPLLISCLNPGLKPKGDIGIFYSCERAHDVGCAACIFDRPMLKDGTAWLFFGTTQLNGATQGWLIFLTQQRLRKKNWEEAKSDPLFMVLKAILKYNGSLSYHLKEVKYLIFTSFIFFRNSLFKSGKAKNKSVKISSSSLFWFASNLFLFLL